MILKLFLRATSAADVNQMYYLNRCTLSNILAEIVALAAWQSCGGGASGCGEQALME